MRFAVYGDGSLGSANIICVIADASMDNNNLYFIHMQSTSYQHVVLFFFWKYGNLPSGGFLKAATEIEWKLVILYKILDDDLIY